MSWAGNVHSQLGGSALNGATGDAALDSEVVTLLIIAEAQRLQGLYAAFLGDARFQVLATATSADDVRAKLAMNPDAVVVEGSVFGGPDEFTSTFAGFGRTVYTLLPESVLPSHADVIRATPSVQSVVIGEPNFTTLAGQIYAGAQAQQRSSHVSSGSSALFSSTYGPSITTVGWRAIAVWSPQGGVGKSTIASAIAFEAASRRLPTLLVGLGAPDPLPLATGLHPEPNIVSWQASPSPETLRESIQSLDVLDVLAGFPEPLALNNYLPDALDGAASLPNLTNAAAHAGYAVVVLDVSSQELAAAALAAANTLVLVTIPTLPSVLNAAEAVHLVNDVMAGQHRIARQATHLVVNKVRDSTLRPEEVVKSGASIRKDFPSLAAVLNDDPQIEVALNQRRPAWHHSEQLRRMSSTLGDLLFAAPAALAAQQEELTGRPARVFNLGPIRIKTS